MGKQRVAVYSVCVNFEFTCNDCNYWKILLIGVPIQQRYILVLMVFLAVMVGLAQRTILPMAITGMVHAPHKNNDEKPPAESYCIAPEWASNQTSPASGEETVSFKFEKIKLKEKCKFIIVICFPFPSRLTSNMIGRRNSKA